MKSVIGQRVAAARKLRGLTQQELADRAHTSYSLLSKVEAGQVPATPGFVAAVARALQVELGDLTGQPYRGTTPSSDRANAAVAGLREALWQHGPPDDPADVPGQHVLAELRPLLAAAAGRRGAARYVQLAEALPGLVRQLLAAAASTRPGHTLEQVYGALADVYSMAQTVTRMLGYTDLAALAVERMAWAAARSADPLWQAVAAEKRSAVDLLVGSYDAGLRAVAVEAARVEAADDRPQALAVAGQLHLRAAALAARSARADRARDELAVAAEYAARLPADPPEYYGLAFGAANVRIDRVAAEVELGEGTRAVELAAGWDPAGLIAPDRAGHHHITLARGRMMHGDQDGALAELYAAREVAPQLARHHPMVRETLDVLARTSRRGSEQLRQLAAWVGLSG